MTTAVSERVTDWRRACYEVTCDILQQCGVNEPPVNAWLLAQRLKLQVAFDAGQAGRGRLKRIAGRTAILLRPEERPERAQWTLAHEIGEAFASRVFAKLDADPVEMHPGQREQVANAMASSLLLPDDWFERDAIAVDGDVLRLKRIYRTASHELILLSLLKLPQLTLVSVFDHGRLTRRRGNGQLPPPPLLPLEQTLHRMVHDTGQPAAATGQGVRVQCWPVVEPGWRRELLRTTALEGIDESAAGDDDEWADDDHDDQLETTRADGIGRQD